MSFDPKEQFISNDLEDEYDFVNGEASETIAFGEIVAKQLNTTAGSLPTDAQATKVVTMDATGAWVNGPLYVCITPGGVAAGATGVFKARGQCKVLMATIIQSANGAKAFVNGTAGNAKCSGTGDRIVGSVLVAGTGTGVTKDCYFDGTSLNDATV